MARLPLSLFLLLSAVSCGSERSADEVSEAVLDVGPLADIADGDLAHPADAAVGDGASPDDVASDHVPPPKSLDEATASALQSVLDDFIYFTGDPGVTLSVRNGDGEWFSGASGVRDWQTNTPLDSSTLFRAGSSTKPFVAVLLLQLRDEGLVDLDAPLTDYLPQYPQWDAVTVRHLLGMQSGLVDYLNAESLWLDAFFSDKGFMAPGELVSYVADEPLLFTPGEACAYNNTNYLLAGMIIEAVTGNPAVQELHTRIIEPLGLTGTYLDTSAEPKDELAHGYMDINVVAWMFGIPVEAASFIPAEFYWSEGILDCTYLFHPSVTWTAGAMLTSAEDMVVFMRALLTGGLLSGDALAEMMQFHECDLLGGKVQYGLGLMEYQTPAGKAYGHGGLNFGYEAGTTYHPDLDLALSHMHGYLPEQSAALVRETYEVLLEGETAPPVPCKPPQDFFALEEAGNYLNLRFKGPINPQSAIFPQAGIAHIRAFLDGEDMPLYGIAPLARLNENTLAARVQVESIAPTLEKDFQLRQGVLNVDAGALKELPPDGTITLSAATPYKVYAAVWDIAMNPTFTVPEKICLRAVPDFTRPSKVHVCDPETFQPEVGNELRVFASIALNSDAAAIEEYISVLDLSRCMCPDDDGQWGECPAEDQ